MENNDLYEKYLETKNNKLLFNFKGAFSEDIVIELGSIIRFSIGSEKNVKKVFSVFIELVQNIIKYSLEQENYFNDYVGVGIIELKEKDDFYILNSGNLISIDNIEKIKFFCDKINDMNRDQLKKFYQEKIRKPLEKESKGAGLGLIEIARKSEAFQPLRYYFSSVDDCSCFFTLSVFVKK
jgi:hypothetical protein